MRNIIGWARIFIFVFGLKLIWFYMSCEYECLNQIPNLESQTPNCSKCTELNMELVTLNSPLNKWGRPEMILRNMINRVVIWGKVIQTGLTLSSGMELWFHLRWSFMERNVWFENGACWLLHQVKKSRFNQKNILNLTPTLTAVNSCYLRRGDIHISTNKEE